MAEYKPGDVANGHVWTGTQWLPLAQQAPPGAPPPVGTIANGHRWDGTRWVPLPTYPSPPGAVVPAVAPRGRDNNKTVIGIAVGLVAVLAVIVIAAAVNQANKPSRSASSASTSSGGGSTAQDSSAWIPSGWKQWDSTTAFKLNSRSSNCPSYADKCTEVLVMPRYGCESIYVEASGENSAGTVVDYANDLSGAVAPMQQARLILTFDAEVAAYTVGEINCH